MFKITIAFPIASKWQIRMQAQGSTGQELVPSPLSHIVSPADLSLQGSWIKERCGHMGWVSREGFLVEMKTPVGWHEAPHLGRWTSCKHSPNQLSPLIPRVKAGSPASYCCRAKNMPSSGPGDILSCLSQPDSLWRMACLSPPPGSPHPALLWSSPTALQRNN